tara:strand:+ start:6181 stop:7062 length:882 start_codon:yes stop_codon:yes gene_type:complete
MDSLIRVINSPNELIDTLNFLRDGFGEKEKWVYQLYEHLIVANESIGFYGFKMNDDKENICGALLLIKQSDMIISKKEKTVLNISGWYMRPEFRGLKAIIFAQEVVKRTNEYILTSYTPSEPTIPIWMRLGFKKFTTKIYTCTILSALNNLNINFYKLKLVSQKYVRDRYSQVNDATCLGNITFYKVIYKNNELIIAGSRKIIKKFGINIPIYKILWSSDNERFNEIINGISLQILIRTSSIFLSYFYFSTNNNVRFRNYSIFKGWESISIIVIKPNTNFISPIGSELSLEII